MTTAKQDRASVELTRIMDGAIVAQLIQLVAEFGVADLVDGTRSTADIAASTDTDPDVLYRVLRTLAGVGMFTERPGRTFDLTPLAGPLRSNAPDSVSGLATVRGSREHWVALGELRHSLQTGRSSFTHVHGQDWWSYLDENTEQAALFSKAMGDNAQQVHEAVADAYDFPGTQELVDVGGGRGDLVATLLRRHPRMRAIVFDRPYATTGSTEVLADVADRAKPVPGDFFESIPAGGDTYLLCRILHDWDDERAARILRNVAEVLPKNGRVIVAEAVVPEGDAPHPAKFMDITMLAMHEGKERSEAEFAALLASAGLRHLQTVTTDAEIGLVLAESA